MKIQLKYHDKGVDTLNYKSHFHNNEFEILHIIDGDGTIMIKDTLYALNSNMIYFINNHDVHYTSPKNPQSYIRNKIIFPYEILIDLARTLQVESLIESMFLHGATAISLSTTSSVKIDKCFLSLSQQLECDVVTSNINFFVNIFTILDIAAIEKNAKANRLQNRTADVISFINQNLQNKLTLDLICENVNVSKFYLCHNFKNTVGMTVFQYVEFMRISLAKDLLVKTDDSISDISQKAGFESFAYFSKVFRKHEGCTPSKYRNKNINRLL